MNASQCSGGCGDTAKYLTDTSIFFIPNSLLSADIIHICTDRLSNSNCCAKATRCLYCLTENSHSQGTEV